MAAPCERSRSTASSRRPYWHMSPSAAPLGAYTRYAASRAHIWRIWNSLPAHSAELRMKRSLSSRSAGIAGSTPSLAVPSHASSETIRRSHVSSFSLASLFLERLSTWP